MPNTVDVTKQTNPKAAQMSVVDTPPAAERSGVAHPFILGMAAIADDIPKWGTDVKGRDQKLREFWHTEPVLAGAVFAAVSRNASFKWEVASTDPDSPAPERTLRAVHNMLNSNTDLGKGWFDYRIKVMTDLCTQDNGAFHELVRTKDSPSAPVISINHLDSAMCERTGDPEVPVIYTDRIGREIPLKWYQVMVDSLFPSPLEQMYGVQYSPLTLALLAAQILRDITVYKREKVSGGNTRAIHFVTGVTQNTIDDGKAWAREQNLNLSNYRYTDPVVIPGLDPSNPVSVATIELASLPDAFDEETSFKWYITQLANAFGMDYQELAPLPGGQLGSSQQSVVLHQKAQGKGPALSMAQTEHLINNNGVIPRTVTFRYKLHDLRTEAEMAEAAHTRAKSRALMINSGVYDPEGALEMAVEDGDIPRHIAKGIEDRGLALQWYEARIGSRDNQAGGEQIQGGLDSQTGD